MKIKEKFKIAVDTWKATLGLFKRNPAILIPFALVGLLDAVILLLIYLAPRPPLSALLAPPIRAFWGERFLHYPSNLLLIPRLFDYGRIISTALMGVLMTGAAIGMLKQAGEGLKPKILFNLVKSLRMYLRLLVIWLAVFGLITAVLKGFPFVLRLKPGAASQLLRYGGFLISILIQVIFIYAMPAVMIEEKKAWAAIKRSLSFSKSAFLASLILVMAPMLVYIPLIILRGKLALLMSKLFPEAVLIFLGLNILASVIIDCLVTCSTAILFLNKKKDE